MPTPSTSSQTHRFATLLAAAALVLVLGWRLQHRPALEPHALQDTGFRIDVNRADAATLQLLPGLGPSIAANVVERRETAGPFGSVEELEDVRMIGPVLRERIEPWVTLGDVAANED